MTKRPKECLFYFMDGRGVMSIYDPIPGEDVYEIRQDTAVWITPEIKHEIKNVGNYPLGYLCFSAWIE